jgi:sec-independent protein translocase protein TatC
VTTKKPELTVDKSADLKKDSPEKNTDSESGSPKTEMALPKQDIFTHFKVLRRVIIISIITVAACFLVVFFGFSQPILIFLQAPIKERGIDLIYISLYETMFIQMKLSFMISVIAASPVILGALWTFIKPALYPRETHLAIILFFITVLLFLTGALFGYLIVFNMALTFFITTSEGIARPFISIERYINFLTGMVLPFGLVFELPIAMVILTRSGLVSVKTFTKFRKYIILAIFVAAAILTPPDVVSQILLALPLLVLFETGIVVSRILQRKKVFKE